MHAFDVAAQAVAEALRTGQIGTPVAIRVVAALTADHGRIERQLARILEACADWLGSRPDQLTALGGVEVGQVRMGARVTGAPMTYAVGGRQYIAVAIGGPGYPSELVAYRLKTA